MFAIDRAGIVGAQLDKHPGAFDLSPYLPGIPDMVIMTPSDETGNRQMLFAGYHFITTADGGTLSRGNARGVALTPLEKLPCVVKRRCEASWRKTGDSELWHLNA